MVVRLIILCSLTDGCQANWKNEVYTMYLILKETDISYKTPHMVSYCQLYNKSAEYDLWYPKLS